MRTTVDLPDDLYRSLKARAALSGTTMRDLITTIIRAGLGSPPMGEGAGSRRSDPPVIVAATGKPIASLSSEELKALEEADDRERLARSS